MKGEKLQDAIGMVEDELIKDADMMQGKRHTKEWWKYVAVAASVLILFVSVGVVLLRDDDNVDRDVAEPTQLVDNNIIKSEQASTESKNAPTQKNENPTGSGSAELETNAPEVEGNVVDLHTFAIATCSYPKMAQYPDESKSTYSEDYDKWSDDRQALKEAYKNMSINQDKFLSSSIREMLKGSDVENKVYSPLNVYMALGMLAEITDGNSRKQVLDALGVNDIETLRQEANAIWKANYCDDGAVSTILASSLWLNEDVNFKDGTLKNLATTYYASAYQGEMGSAEFNNALQEWLNEHTRNLLEGQINNIEMNPNTVLSLASTIYYSARWTDKFNGTVMKRFYGSAGEELCHFMEQSSTRSYYWGEKFSTVPQYLEGSGEMWFILPDEGVSVDELLADEEAMEFILSTEKWKWENCNRLKVNLSVPKFDVTSQINLKDGLMKLGITDVFDSAVSDFTPMTDTVNDVCLSAASHGARVKIDEEGCEAAAYTIMSTESEAITPDEEMDFVVNRPFIFVVTSDVGMPLFVGVVNNMS